VGGPDGRRLAAAAERDRNLDIFRAPIGGSRIWLTKHPGRDSEPAWSPDGSRIAFVSYRDWPDGPAIYVMDSDGGGLRRLTDAPWQSNEPAWSPDGERLAYAAGDGEGASILRVLDVATGVDRPLTEDDASRRSPAWSWDGRFLADEYHVPGVRGYHIRVRTLDGRDDWSVTDSTLGRNSSPAWTPSGDISFLMLGQQRHNIGVVGPRGGDVEMLTNTGTYKEHLTWYNPRYFPVQAAAILQPQMWGWIKRPYVRTSATPPRVRTADRSPL